MAPSLAFFSFIGSVIEVWVKVMKSSSVFVPRKWGEVLGFVDKGDCDDTDQ